MGLLDDAIREHLELKRRSGSDDPDPAGDEHEQESLAPSLPAQLTDAPAGDYEGHPAAPASAEVGGPAFYDADDDYPEEPVYAAPTPAPAPPALDVSASIAPDVPASIAPSGPPTEEYRLPPADGDDEDVLERTPDFLQETPEHDRLWFEQAPPQEFDFDK